MIARCRFSTLNARTASNDLLNGLPLGEVGRCAAIGSFDAKLAPRHGIGWAAAAIVVLAALTGCGEQLATVTGTVTLDGEPIAGGGDVRGTVTFYPSDGRGAPAVGILNEQGKYTVSASSGTGIPPGAYEIAVAATKIIIPKPGATPSGRPLTPRRYARANESGFTADLQPGSNVCDFALVSNGTSQ